MQVSSDTRQSDILFVRGSFLRPAAEVNASPGESHSILRAFDEPPEKSYG